MEILEGIEKIFWIMSSTHFGIFLESTYEILENLGKSLENFENPLKTKLFRKGRNRKQKFL